MNLRTKMKTTIFERFKRRFSYFSLSFAEPLYICFRTIRFDHPQTHRKQNHRMQHSIHRWILFFGFEFSEQLIPKNPLFSHFIYYHCYRLLPTSNLKDKRTKKKTLNDCGEKLQPQNKSILCDRVQHSLNFLTLVDDQRNMYLMSVFSFFVDIPILFINISQSRRSHFVFQTNFIILF